MDEKFEMPSDEELQALDWLRENYSMDNEDGPRLHTYIKRYEDGGGIMFLVANDGSHHRFSRALADYVKFYQSRGVVNDDGL